MELISLIIIIYAISKAVEDSKKAYRKSKTSYMRSVDSRFPQLPKPQRAARAVQHDVGYWSAHALRGFPAARRGFSAGWKEARQLKADGKPVLWRNVTPPGAEDLPAAREGRENGGEGSPVAPGGAADGWIDYVTANEDGTVSVDTRRADAGPGAAVPPGGTRRVDGKPETDADRRFFDLRESGYKGAIDQDGNIPADAGGPGENADPHDCNTPGCGCGCHGTTEPESAGMAAHQPAGTETTTEGTPTMPVAADTTYDGVLRSMTVAKADAEVKATEAQQASTQADGLADAMQGLKVDPGTMSAMSDHQDAHDEVMKAHQKLFETAEAVEAALKRGHAGLAEAHQNAPVTAAEREFYQD